jgi:hypothetical protein
MTNALIYSNHSKIPHISNAYKYIFLDSYTCMFELNIMYIPRDFI